MVINIIYHCEEFETFYMFCDGPLKLTHSMKDKQSLKITLQEKRIFNEMGKHRILQTHE